MQIQLKQSEIETAIRSYIRAIGLSMPVGEISFTAARGPSGMTAEVEILENTTDLQESTAPAVKETAISSKEIHVKAKEPKDTPKPTRARKETPASVDEPPATEPEEAEVEEGPVETTAPEQEEKAVPTKKSLFA